MKSLVVRVANCQGVSERDPHEEAELAITREGKYGLPDVILLSEVSWLDAHLLAKQHGWVAVQHGTRGSAEAGVAILSRITPAKVKRPIVGSLATREGGGIRLRPIVGAKIGGLSFWACHAPPSRSPVARLAYIARARARGGVVGGDLNVNASWMRSRVVRQYRGIGVLGLLVPLQWKASAAQSVDIGSDHPAVDVRITRRAAR